MYKIGDYVIYRDKQLERIGKVIDIRQEGIRQDLKVEWHAYHLAAYYVPSYKVNLISENLYNSIVMKFLLEQ